MAADLISVLPMVRCASRAPIPLVDCPTLICSMRRAINFASVATFNRDKSSANQSRHTTRGDHHPT